MLPTRRGIRFELGVSRANRKGERGTKLIRGAPQRAEVGLRLSGDDADSEEAVGIPCGAVLLASRKYFSPQTEN